MSESNYPIVITRRARLSLALSGALLKAATEMARHTAASFRIQRPAARRGGTLRPGRETPLWNELRRELRPHLARHGEQAKLARLLGLPRQRVQAFMTQGSQMPDAERTLQLLAWLSLVQQRRRPS